MRSRDATFTALLEGDALDLVALVEISTGATDPLRYALDTADRTWDGKVWTATAGAFQEIQESAQREVPSLQLVLQNADGVLGPQLDPQVSGGRDIRGRRVTIRQADRRRLSGATAADLVIEWTFFVADVAWLDPGAVAIGLGVFPAETVQVPDRTCQGLRCRWAYRGLHCGYGGALATCDRTRADCGRHFPGEPLRFGGFPTAADARALRVD